MRLPAAVLIAAAVLPVSDAGAAPTLKGRAVWASPRDAGTTEESVAAFVDQLAKAHVNVLVMEVKTSAGLFWPSERFAAAVVPEYRAFDFPAVLVRLCHKKKIAVHAWFFDYAEGADSYVVGRSTRSGSPSAPRGSRPRPRSCAAGRTGWPGCARPGGPATPTSG